MNESNVKKFEVYALATDPIYIGTGGYNIGRVDNTIVRDPITNVPKIPGSSLAGTWRYYVVLEALKDIKDKQPKWEDIKSENGNTIGEKLKNYNWKNISGDKPFGWKGFEGNQIMKLTCAGQDNIPQEDLAKSPYAVNKDGKTGHCGHCIVCKGFGFSKKDISWQGVIFFSDLNILFFPVFTFKGTKWITTQKIIERINLGNNREQTSGDNDENNSQNNEKVCLGYEKLSVDETDGHINLGWLYLPYKFNVNDSLKNKLSNILKKLSENNIIVNLSLRDIIIVPEDLFSHIVNSNLEVRTSVSIDPITGAAKEGALFTSEAIPRGTIFYGTIRVFDKKGFEELEEKLEPLPTSEQLEESLKDSMHFYETLGIGGMTTRGFGRLKIELLNSAGGENE